MQIAGIYFGLYTLVVFLFTLIITGCTVLTQLSNNDHFKLKTFILYESQEGACEPINIKYITVNKVL